MATLLVVIAEMAMSGLAGEVPGRRAISVSAKMALAERAKADRGVMGDDHVSDRLGRATEIGDSSRATGRPGRATEARLAVQLDAGECVGLGEAATETQAADEPRVGRNGTETSIGAGGESLSLDLRPVAPSPAPLSLWPRRRLRQRADGLVLGGAE
jgi:hypothetical protein